MSKNKKIAGVDEVGRGCLAGPVFAAAVILNKSIKQSVNDNSAKKIEIKSYLIILLACLRFIRPSKYLYFCKLILNSFKKKWYKVLVLDYLISENLNYTISKPEVFKRNNKLLLLDGGNFFQGHPLGISDSGRTVIKWMNKLGYHGLVPGNYDFIFGLDNLIDLFQL